VVALPGFFLPHLVALFVGSTMTATSIGITVRVLADLKRQDSSDETCDSSFYADLLCHGQIVTQLPRD
jgi:hypothetical protein